MKPYGLITEVVMKKLVIYFIIIVGTFANLYAVDSSALLFDTFNAETIGRGGANTAWINDADFMGNPALLASIKNISISLSYWRYILDMNFVNSSIIYNIDNKYGTAGININMFDSGEFTLFDSAGNTSENISGKNMIFTFGYALQDLFVKNFDFGVGIKYINNSLYNATASSFAFDAGVLYGLNLIKLGSKSANNNFFIGLSVLNIGTGLSYSAEKTSLPINIKAGIMHNIYQHKSINIKYGADFSYLDSNTEITVGTEFEIMHLIALRGGYVVGNDISGVNTGIGIKYSKNGVKFNFNYSLIPMSDFGITHNISLNIVINKDLFGMEKAESNVDEVE